MSKRSLKSLWEAETCKPGDTMGQCDSISDKFPSPAPCHHHWLPPSLSPQHSPTVIFPGAKIQSLPLVPLHVCDGRKCRTPRPPFLPCSRGAPTLMPSPTLPQKPDLLPWYHPEPMSNGFVSPTPLVMLPEFYLLNET